MTERSETEHPAVAPTNVRIVRADGREIPLEVRYVDTVTHDDGAPIHKWEAISEYVPNAEAGDKIAMDVLPARTSISLTFRGLNGG